MASEGADILWTSPGGPYDSPTPDDLLETVEIVEGWTGACSTDMRRAGPMVEKTEFVDNGVAGPPRRRLGGCGHLHPATWDETSPTMFKDTGMTRGFAAGLGEHGARVDSVHPGAVNNPTGLAGTAPCSRGPWTMKTQPTR